MTKINPMEAIQLKILTLLLNQLLRQPEEAVVAVAATTWVKSPKKAHLKKMITRNRKSRVAPTHQKLLLRKTMMRRAKMMAKSPKKSLSRYWLPCLTMRRRKRKHFLHQISLSIRFLSMITQWWRLASYH